MAKIAVPLGFCAAVVLYSAWMIHFGPGSTRLPKTTDRVEITVHGPDGKIIPPVRRVDSSR